VREREREREKRKRRSTKAEISTANTRARARACAPEFPQEGCQNTDNHVPLHLDALLHFRGAVCMSKLERIITDPPIDHVHTGQKTIGDTDDRCIGIARWGGVRGGGKQERGGNAGGKIEEIYLLIERFG